MSCLCDLDKTGTSGVPKLIFWDIGTQNLKTDHESVYKLY